MYILMILIFPGKLDKDKELFDKTVSGYSFSSFYAGDMSDSEIKTALGEEFLKDVQTVVTDYDLGKRYIRVC